MKAIVYTRVSTREQGDSGLGLAAQEERCKAEIRSRSWMLAWSITEVASLGKRRSTEFETMLRRLDLGHADALMVSRLDRLSRSVGEFASLMARADAKGWKLVILDPPIDMTTPYGRMMGNVAASFAQLERELTSLRTREGLAQLRARGVTKDGRPYEPKPRYGATPEERRTVRRIVRLRVEQAMSKNGIATFLDEAGVPTMNGGRWSHKMVGKILAREGVE